MIVKLRRLHPLPTPTPWLYQVSGLFIVKPSIEVHNRKWWDGATSSVVGFQRPLNFFYKAVSGQGLRVHQQRCGGCTVFTPLQRESFIQSRVRFCVCRRFPARTWIYVRAGYPPPPSSFPPSPLRHVPNDRKRSGFKKIPLPVMRAFKCTQHCRGIIKSSFNPVERQRWGFQASPFWTPNLCMTQMQRAQVLWSNEDTIN